MKVIALTNFEYPASQTVRNRIRAATAKGERIPYDQRGTITQVVVGQELDPPADLAQGWLHNGYVEALTKQEDGAEEVANGKEG